MQIQTKFSGGNPMRTLKTNKPGDAPENKETFSPSEPERGNRNNLGALAVFLSVPAGGVAGAAIGGFGAAKLASMATDSALAPWLGGAAGAVVGGSVGLLATWAAVWGKMGD